MKHIEFIDGKTFEFMDEKPVYVFVEVCLYSGLLPNPYCPRKVTWRFEVGSEPKEICEIHQPPKPKSCSYYLKRWNIWCWLKCLWRENF
jgi:hypothetical protein